MVELRKLCFMQKIYRETKKIIKPNFLENGLDNAAWMGLVKILSIKQPKLSLKLCLAASKYFICDLQVISPLSMFVVPAVHMINS